MGQQSSRWALTVHVGPSPPWLRPPVSVLQEADGAATKAAAAPAAAGRPPSRPARDSGPPEEWSALPATLGSEDDLGDVPRSNWILRGLHSKHVLGARRDLWRQTQNRPTCSPGHCTWTRRMRDGRLSPSYPPRGLRRSHRARRRRHPALLHLPGRLQDVVGTARAHWFEDMGAIPGIIHELLSARRCTLSVVQLQNCMEWMHAGRRDVAQFLWNWIAHESRQVAPLTAFCRCYGGFCRTCSGKHGWLHVRT